MKFSALGLNLKKVRVFGTRKWPATQNSEVKPSTKTYGLQAAPIDRNLSTLASAVILQ